MTREQIEARIRAFVAAQNARDLDGVVSAFSPDGARVRGVSVTRGHEALRRTYERSWRAFTNRTLTVNRLTVEASRVVMEYMERATHVAPAETVFGEIPASQKAFDVYGCAVFDFDEQGILELRLYSDALFQMLALSAGRRAAGN